MNTQPQKDPTHMDDEKRFVHFMILCATGGTDPFMVGNNDADTVARLQKNPYLRHNGEVLFLAEAEQGSKRKFGGLRTWWYRWRPTGMVDRQLGRFAKEGGKDICWSIVKCFGTTGGHRSELGVVTYSGPGPATGQDGAVPDGMSINKWTFKVRVIGIPPEELKTLAKDIGYRLGEREVYIRRFNADEWDTVTIG